MIQLISKHQNCQDAQRVRELAEQRFGPVTLGFLSATEFDRILEAAKC